ncbi:ADP-ribosylglycohydrolase family protein [Bartonella sp. HY038]
MGGAIGDALGAPVEFVGYDEIINKFGKKIPNIHMLMVVWLKLLMILK